MRVSAAAALLMLPLSAHAGRLWELDAPNLAAIETATTGSTFVLTADGAVYEVGSTWEREVHLDPPLPLAEIAWWGATALIDAYGNAWHYQSTGNWQNIGTVPGPTDANEIDVSSRPAHSSPNPAAGTTRICFSVAIGGPVAVRIFDVSGRIIRTVHEGHLPAGDAVIEWDGRSDVGEQLPAGIYFSRVETPSGVSRERLVRQ